MNVALVLLRIMHLSCCARCIFLPGAPSKVFLCLLIAELFSQQQTSFLVAPVAWQFLILQEQGQMVGYR